MKQPPGDPLLGLVVLVVLVASAVTWIGLFVRQKRGRQWLAYEPRSPVPWGWPIGMLAVVYVALTFITPSGVDASETDLLHPTEVAQRLAGFILFQVAVISAVLFVVAIAYRASLQDFGLPEYADDVVRDVRLGIVAGFAALGPVYGVQLVMIKLFGESNHPLVEMVASGGTSFGVLLLATIFAVIVAPVSEEILFRLLLQGWLEKREDQNVRVSPDGSPDESTIQAWNSNLENSTSILITSGPASHGLFGLPYGWTPIFTSSLLFAAAHSGYGPDPVAIFCLAVVLGYLYHRTHRILPCIVAHAVFNSVAALMLWRMVFLNFE